MSHDEREIIRVSKDTLAQWHALEEEVTAISKAEGDSFLYYALQLWAIHNHKNIRDMKALAHYVQCLDYFGADAFTVIE